MKLSLLALPLLLAAAPLAALDGGYYELKLTADGGGGNFRIYHADAGTRIEMALELPQMPGGGLRRVSLVRAADPAKVVTLDERGRNYSETALSDRGREADGGPATVTVLGREKIGGYNCIHVTVTRGERRWEMWNTADIAEYGRFSAVWGRNPYAGDRALHEALQAQGAEGFPVRVIYHGREGTITIELVKLERRSLDPGLFEIPPGYTRAAGPVSAGPERPSAADLMKMTPEERQRYIEQMKRQYGGAKP